MARRPWGAARTRLQTLASLAVAGSIAAGAVGAQEAGRWTRTGTLDAGFVSATGNTEVTTLSLGVKASFQRSVWTLRQAAAYVYGKTGDTESANQLRLLGRAELALRERLAAFGALVFERNPYAGFDRRVDEHLGAQWRAVATPRDSLTLDGGGVLTQQENADGSARRSSSARAALAYRHGFSRGATGQQWLEYVPDLNSAGRYRLNSETAIGAPLAGRLSLKVSLLIQYNSQPPSGFGTTDRVFTSGIQLKF